METVGEYIIHTSTQLNDQRHGRAFTRWGRGLLLDYLNLGLSEIGTYRPEAFTTTMPVTLVPGTRQVVPSGVDIMSVETNADGSSITKMDSTLADSFSAYDICPPSITFVDGTPVYRARSYSIDATNSKVFVVEPAVPAGMSPVVNISVTGSAPRYTLSDWDKSVDMPEKFGMSLIDFMLAQAYRVQTESQSARATSGQLFAQFYNVMGVKYKQESKFNSGYYLGATGTGDPRVGP